MAGEMDSGPNILRKEDDVRICSCFLKKLASVKDKGKRLKILKACAGLQAAWPERLFWESLGDPCEAVRDFLVRNLVQRDRFDLDLALARLQKPPWYAKSAALQVLGLRKAAGAVPCIGRLAADDNADVRRNAALALGEIGGKEAVAYLVKLSQDGSVYVKTAAEQALEKTSNLKFS